jgi:ATP-dependent DNA helicase RecQ
MNTAWNVNLLLFLHRSGLIKITDTSYNSINGSYYVNVRLLDVVTLNDKDLLNESLVSIRKEELDKQLEGYRVMKSIVQKPNKHCWGHVFKTLFPLAKEHCGGCPTHDTAHLSKDNKFKLRMKPNMLYPAAIFSEKINMIMGSYDQLIVNYIFTPIMDIKLLFQIIQKINEMGIKCLVIDENYAIAESFNGLCLTREEFSFSVKMMPYLFFKGVVCVFGNSQQDNNDLFNELKLLTKFHYKQFYICNDEMYIESSAKSLRESFEGYIISASDFMEEFYV